MLLELSDIHTYYGNIRALKGVSPWSVVAFFLSRNARLGSRRPLDMLRRGDVTAVVGAARAYGEHGAA